MFNKILKFANLFYKLAAIQFPESLSWVPKEIKQHQAFKDYPSEQIEKIFPQFGISDFREKLTDFDMRDYDIAKHLLFAMKNSLFTAKLELRSYTGEYPYSPENLKAISYQRFIEVFINELSNILSQIKGNDVPSTIKLLQDISTPDFSARAGISIFKLYVKLQDKLQKLFSIPLLSLEELPEFIDFLRMFEQPTLVFSTKFEDLIGYGSRGSASCQSFFVKEDPNKIKVDKHNIRTIGTALSKYTGVIYLTSGRSYRNLGEKMIARSLVRIIYNVDTDEPIIIVEKIYPPSDKSEYIQDFFIRKLQEKSDIMIFSAYDLGMGRIGPMGEEYNITDFYVKPEEYIGEEFAPYEDAILSTKINLEDFYKQPESVKLDIIDRLSPEKMLLYIHDPSPMVKIRIIRNIPAEFVDKDFVSKFINNPHVVVRRALLNRIPKELLPLLNQDKDPGIRRVVAMDSAITNISNMLNDSDKIVRQIIKARKENDEEQIRYLKDQVYEIL